MKHTSEKYIERRLVDQINSLGGMCIKLLSDYMVGLPDRMCLLPGGRIYFVELKSTGKKPRRIQSYIHAVIRGLGFPVLVIDSEEGVEDLISHLKGGTHGQE
jgi:hypothetical protein